MLKKDMKKRKKMKMKKDFTYFRHMFQGIKMTANVSF